MEIIMTNTFDQELVDTAPEFSSTFGETGTYYPFGGDAREIAAIVNRQEPAELDGAPHGAAPKLTIDVENDATTGISSSEVNTMKDEYKLPVRIGETAQKRLIIEILSQDAGRMKLELS